MEFNFSTAKILNFLGKYYLWIAGVVFLLCFILNIYIYYQSIYLVLNTPVDVESSELILDQELLDQVLGEIEQRKNQLEEIEGGYYSNPFAD